MKETIKNLFLKIYEKVKIYILEKIEKLKELIKSASDGLAVLDIEDSMAKYSLNWWFMKSLRWFIATIFAIITLFLWGCSGVATTKYYPVSIPIVCSIDIPIKPEYSEDTVITNINILAYAEKLKSALNVCVNGGLND